MKPFLFPLLIVSFLFGGCAGWESSITEGLVEGQLQIVSSSPDCTGMRRLGNLRKRSPRIDSFLEIHGTPSYLFEDDHSSGGEFVVFFYPSEQRLIGFRKKSHVSPAYEKMDWQTYKSSDGPLDGLAYAYMNEERKKRSVADVLLQ
ncbi:MAG: hypothetical protein AAGA58_19430 [Verrucomicrobiota bacterium]